MPAARLRTAALVLATSFAVSGVAVSEASAARVSARPTGDAQLDSYCRQAADLVNEAIAESERLDVLGHFEEGQAWWDLAMELLGRSRANGCQFAAARVVLKASAQRRSLMQIATVHRG